MIKLRLKLVEHMNFTRSEQTNLDMLAKRLADLNMTRSDVVCLVSKDDRQYVFAWLPRVVDFAAYDRRLPRERHNGKLRKATVMAYVTVKMRITHGTWDILMLQNYANDVGIELDGIKRFEEIIGIVKRQVSNIIPLTSARVQTRKAVR